MMAHFSTRFSFFLAALIFLSACQQEKPQVKRPQPLKQDPFVEVYFNRNQARGANYREPYRKIKRAGDNLEQKIVDAIASAETSVDVAVQELRLPKIAQALVERHEAGVKVRIMIENDYSRPYSKLSAAEVAQLDKRDRARYEEARALIDSNQDGELSPSEINKRDALVMLDNAGVPLIDDTADGSKGSGLMHHKFVVIDKDTTIVTSANFTTSGIHGDFSSPESRGNANNLLKIDSPQLASIFTQEFNLMWGDGPGGKPDSKFGLQKRSRTFSSITVGENTISVHFSPTSSTRPWRLSSNGFIGEALKSATSSIDIALFVFSEQPLANILASRHQQGAKVSALIDSSFAYRYYSEGLDMLGVALARKCEYESGNRPWNPPVSTVGVPQLPRGDKLHHKFAVVDEQAVITGSHNWSASANTSNDETVLVVKNPTVAAHFTREFERLYSRAVLGIPVGVQKKIEAQQQECT